MLPNQNELARFEAVAMPQFPAVYRTAVWMLRNRTEAQDVVQEVYLQAWMSFHRFEPDTNCKAWLLKILLNQIRRYRRRWFRVRARETNASAAPEPISESRADESAMPEELQEESVIAALDSLPLEFREVVMLCDLHDFSYAEIAKTLDIPVGTVMSRLSRGRHLLRPKLADTARQFGIRSAR